MAHGLHGLKPILKAPDDRVVVGKAHCPQVIGQGRVNLNLLLLVLMEPDLVLEAGEADGAIIEAHSHNHH